MSAPIYDPDSQPCKTEEPTSMADSPVTHWLQIATSALSSLGAAIAFRKGLQASRQQIAPPNDDLQTRLARAEARIELLEHIALAQLPHAPTLAVPPNAAPAQSDSH